jgi:hypothetical protein
MIELLFRPFYAATITMTADGGLLVASARERVLAWGIVFCLVAAAALTLWLFRVSRRWSLAAFCCSLFIPAVIMPSLSLESIHVLPERITVTGGTWLAPERKVLDLTRLNHIREEETRFRVAGYYVEPNAIWHVHHQGGGSDTLILNDFFTAHRMVVAQYLRDRGLRVAL